MGTEQCPSNMCEHTVGDHYTDLYPGNPVCCKIDGCTCGKIILTQEQWDKLQELLDRPAKHNPRLEELFKRPRKFD